MSDYGEERERVSIEFLESVGFEVVNPNSEENERGFEERGMDHFFDLVAKCGSVAFQRFPGGQIGAGVGKEITHGQVLGLPVFEIKDGGLLVPIIDVVEVQPDFLSVEATIALLDSLKA